MLFRDRTEAGQKLALLLRRYNHRKDVVVLGLPRGGVPVAYEIATALGAPLDVFVLRKLGVPDHEELAFGAIASGGVRVLDDEIIEAFGLSDLDIQTVTESEQRELERREALYRGGRPRLDVKDKTVILVDDGIATGSSMRAAITAIRQVKPTRRGCHSSGSRVYVYGAERRGGRSRLRGNPLQFPDRWPILRQLLADNRR